MPLVDVRGEFKVTVLRSALLLGCFTVLRRTTDRSDRLGGIGHGLDVTIIAIIVIVIVGIIIVIVIVGIIIIAIAIITLLRVPARSC